MPSVSRFYELVRAFVRWFVPPCVHCEELGYNCYVCAERQASPRQSKDLE
jgi:hypothetical protein